MNGYWIKFKDGSRGYCEGVSAYDAVQIAEKFSGKIADVGENKWQPIVDTLPYPAKPIIWQFEHPIHGKTPAFCYTPEKCMNKGCCHTNPACTE